ncbi:MAG: hypothetical protein ACLTYW_06140 [Collinsella sp.]
MVTSQYQLIDWEKKELLASGELDCVSGSFSMTGRENEYCWAGPYLASRQVVAVDPQSDIYTLADLEDKVRGGQSYQARAFCSIVQMKTFRRSRSSTAFRTAHA